MPIHRTVCATYCSLLNSLFFLFWYSSVNKLNISIIRFERSQRMDYFFRIFILWMVRAAHLKQTGICSSSSSRENKTIPTSTARIWICVRKIWWVRAWTIWTITIVSTIIAVIRILAACERGTRSRSCLWNACWSSVIVQHVLQRRIVSISTILYVLWHWYGYCCDRINHCDQQT